MRSSLLAVAAAFGAACLPHSAASAQNFTAQDFASPAFGDQGVVSVGGNGFHGGFGHDGRDGHRRRRSGTVVVGGWGNEGWAMYNNRTFEPDSYNDWWHDRPDRAFPRWMQSNGNCQRMWWSGGGWRC